MLVCRDAEVCPILAAEERYNTLLIMHDIGK